MAALPPSKNVYNFHTTRRYDLRPINTRSIDVPPSTFQMEYEPDVQGLVLEPYPGIKALSKLLRHHTTELMEGRSNQACFAFCNVSQQAITTFHEQRHTLPKCIRISYYPNLQMLIVRLRPGGPHEAASGHFHGLIQDALGPMGLNFRSLKAIGAKIHTGPDGSQKEPDQCFRPRVRPNPTDWPTLILEVGYSETLAQLHRDADWWIEKSNGQVQIVVLVKLSTTTTTKRMHIEVWHSVPNPQNPLTAIRADPPQQTVDITAPSGAALANPTVYTVTGSPLILDFQRIFLRAPVAPEADFSFGVADLQEWAVDAWEEQ
jgi:hypothetical protein